MSDSLAVELRQDKPIALDVSLTCRCGELLALVGPSGSGKTTVLRAIAGLNSPQTGHIMCANQQWLDSAAGLVMPVQRRRIGYVFQEYALFPHKTVIENIMLAVPQKNRKLRHDAARHWLERTNMQGLEKRRPAELSGGQKQRVALARALAREPAALLMDEPFSAVDQQTRRKLYRELARLRKSLQVPIVLVTHDINEVQQLADSVCVIHHGQSLVQGPVDDVMQYPQSKTIARLMGHQNLFSATVANIDRQCARYTLGDGNSLCGPPVGGIQTGDQVILLIKPSAIMIDAGIRGSDNLPYATDRSTIHNKPMFNNQLTGVVSEAIALGDELSVRLHLHTVPKALRFRVTASIATCIKLKTGQELSVCVQPEGIHAMRS